MRNFAVARKSRRLSDEAVAAYLEYVEAVKALCRSDDPCFRNTGVLVLRELHRQLRPRGAGRTHELAAPHRGPRRAAPRAALPRAAPPRAVPPRAARTAEGRAAHG